MSLRQVLGSLPLALAAAAIGCQTAEEPTPQVTPDVNVTGGISGTAGIAGNPGFPFLLDGGRASECGFATSGTASAGFGSPQPQSLVGRTVKSENAPPPISGGTMLTTADGTTVVAADPDRDQLYFVDAAGMRQLHTRELSAGDEPGRLVEDAAGRIHVVLRGGHAIATLSRDAESTITRRNVCAVPRGIAYDAARDQLHVACAEGKLVTLGAEPTAVMPTRTLDLSTDIRDVLVRGDELFVTRFRAAQLLVLNKDGVLQETRTPRSFGHDEKRFVQEDGANNACGKFVSKIVHVEATPNVAWRAIDVPMSGVTMLHQRSRTDEIQVTAGGYGSRSSCGSGIVQTSVTAGLDSQNAPTADMGDLTLAVDIAADPEGNLLAIAAPGNHGVLSQVQLIPLTQLQAAADVAAPADIDAGVAFPSAGSFASPMVPGQDFAPCMSGSLLPDATRQVTAVSFASAHVLAVQEREPAAITFYDLRTHSLRTRVELGGESRLDTGHTIFHVRTGAGLACASCHPEAGDDGLVWTFATIGARRTQTLRGGLLGTEPLHWNGDMDNFEKLVKEVFVGRMSGFAPSAQQSDALSHWLDLQPSLHADAADVAAAQRGKELFESQEVRCSQCHAGSNLTNNQSEDVGTGAKLQVPSLKGVRFRAPLMHDGCAGTISERFTNKQCGGGDSHGVTSQLSTAQISDLVAYLETL